MGVSGIPRVPGVVKKCHREQTCKINQFGFRLKVRYFYGGPRGRAEKPGANM